MNRNDKFNLKELYKENISFEKKMEINLKFRFNETHKYSELNGILKK